MMKRYMMIVIMLGFVAILTSCNRDKAESLEHPEPELFEPIYETDKYTILKRIDIDEAAVYFSIGYSIGEEDDTCTVGEYHKANYRILYKDKYYDIVEGDKLNLYTCNKLNELGVIKRK